MGNFYGPARMALRLNPVNRPSGLPPRETRLRFPALVLLLLVTTQPGLSTIQAQARGSHGLRVSYSRDVPEAGATVLVGLPPAGDVTLTVIEAVAGGTAASVGSCGTEPAQLHVAGWLRGQRIGQLRFGCPKQSGDNPFPYEHIVVDLHFEPRPGAPDQARSDRWTEALLGNLLVNADQARAWLRPPDRAARRPLSAIRAETERWRIQVREEGIYQIDFDALVQAGVLTQSLPSSQLRLYYGGGEALSVGEAAGPQPLVEAPVIVEDGGDGHIDEGDYLLFYGESVNRWEHDPETGTYSFRRNLYTTDNTYFLEVDSAGSGGRAEVRSGAPADAGSLRPTGYRERVHFEEENRIAVRLADQGSGNEWYWEDFRRNARNFPVEISEPLDEPVTLRLGFFGVSLNTHLLRVGWNGTDVGDLEFDGPAYTRHEIETGEVPRPGTNLVGLTALSPRTVRLDWLEVEYSRRHVARNGELIYNGPLHEGPVEFRLKGFEDDSVRVFEVSDGLTEIVDLLWEGDDLVFQDMASGMPRRYLAVSPDRWRQPLEIKRAEVNGVADPVAGAEYLVISHPSFMDAATRLANWRGEDDRFGPPLVARAVSVQSIYDEFSGGLLDPAAIRNFTQHAYENWEPPPFFIALMGDGTYDYRNSSGLAPPNWVPAFQDGENTYDEWYGRVSGGDAVPDLAIGRLPVGSRNQADDVVDKLIAYDRSPEPGPWQGRMLLVADDLRNPDNPGHLESEFLLDAENLAQESLAEDLTLRKLYLADFGFEGRTKPRARDEFIRLYNEGALSLTYLGHGNPDVLAHEQMFVLSRDLDDIANEGRLPLVFTAASQVGPFDRLNGPTIAEALVNLPKGGAVGTISATRIGFHPSNMKLAHQFYQRLFRSGRTHVPVGQALMEAKQLVEAGTTQRDVIQRYSLFGDPATYLALPAYDVKLVVADTLQALEEVRIRGEIVDDEGSVVSTYNGTVEIEVFDSSTPGRLDELPYEQLGGTLFRGRVPVDAGHFVAGFVVPKDITYRATSGSISAYAWSGVGPAGFGRVGDLVLTGTAVGANADDAGPHVRIGFNGVADFVSGGVVKSPAVLLVSLSDSSGINVTGSIGHDIELTLDGQTSSLTRLYQPEEGTYRSGSLEFQLPELETGEHELSLRAWDNHNNTTQETVRFRLEPGRPEIADLRVYPHPVVDEAHLTFETHVRLDRIRVQIFSLSGRLVDSFEGEGARGFHQLAWRPPVDLANGTYLCQVTAVAETGRGVTATVPAVVMR